MKSHLLRKSVFIPSFIIVLGSGIIGLVNNQFLIDCFMFAFDWAYAHFSWLYQLIMVAAVVVCCSLLFSKKGDIRIGGKDAQPKYKFWTWFAMSLTGGIGASIVSSSISQPITFLQSVWGELDGYGIVPGSNEAILFAMGRSLHEWTFFPYTLYAIGSISIAYVCFNQKQPVSVSSTLTPLLGEKATRRGTSSLVDVVTVLALALALVGTLGTFIGLATTCLRRVYHIAPTPLLMLLIMVITTVLYLLSSLSGVDKGIKFFARLNFGFYMLLLVVVFVLGGSAVFSLNMTTSSIGYWLRNLPEWAFDTGISGGSALVKWWTTYNWAFWMAFAPVTGVFLAQLTYGRTIREVLLINWIMPSIFIVLWMTIFGGCAINWQIKGVIDLASVIGQEGTYAGIWAFLQQLPLGFLIIPVTLFIMLLSFVTSADNSVTVISALSMQGKKIGDEAPTVLKIAWGGSIGLLSFLMMAYASGSKGNDGIRYMVVAIGAVLSVFIILQIISTVKMFFFDTHKL